MGSSLSYSNLSVILFYIVIALPFTLYCSIQGERTHPIIMVAQLIFDSLFTLFKNKVRF